MTKEQRFFELISSVDINNPVMDFDTYGNILFWFDYEGKYICEYNLEISWGFLSYDKIWSVFEKEYDLNYTEVQSFMEGMVEKHFGFKGITPTWFNSDPF